MKGRPEAGRFSRHGFRGRDNHEGIQRRCAGGGHTRGVSCHTRGRGGPGGRPLGGRANLAKGAVGPTPLLRHQSFIAARPGVRDMSCARAGIHRSGPAAADLERREREPVRQAELAHGDVRSVQPGVPFRRGGRALRRRSVPRRARRDLGGAGQATVPQPAGDGQPRQAQRRGIRSEGTLRPPVQARVRSRQSGRRGLPTTGSPRRSRRSSAPAA
jgi:hypothetical protein